MNQFDANQMEAIQASLARRQDETLAAIRKLVEIETPSGDFETAAEHTPQTSTS